MKALLPLTTGIIWEGKKFDQSRNTPLKKPTTGFKVKEGKISKNTTTVLRWYKLLVRMSLTNHDQHAVLT